MTVTVAVIGLTGPRAWADACDSAVETIGRAAHTLACRELHGLDGTLRRCTAPAGSPRAKQLGDARWQLGVALGRCTCDGALDASALVGRLSHVENAYALAQLVPAAAQSRACAGAGASRATALAKVEADLHKLQADKAYCRAAGIDLGLDQGPAPTCHEARLRRSALGYWLACPDSAGAAPLVKVLDELQAKVCAAPGTAPSCEDTLAVAEQLRHTHTPAAERQLWSLVTTRLVAAATPGTTDAARSCANRMLATAVPDSAVSGRLDEATVASVMHDPQLRDQFTESLRAALVSSGAAPEIAKLLEDHVDLAQVVTAASQLEDDRRRRFFAVAGGLGRALEAVRAFSAFEQNARGLDVVIEPEPTRCHFADFVNVLLSGLRKAAPAQIAIVDGADAAARVASLVAARERSCGGKPVDGPGCGVVIAVQVEDRAGGRGSGQVQLQFVAPDGSGGAVTRKTTAIPIRDFQAGCSASSEESAAALRLVFDLQFALATNPRESAVVHQRLVRQEVCGLRALPLTALPGEPYDGKGLRLRGPELAARLQGPTDGAREALQAWLPSRGAIDSDNASATLRFSSAPYRDRDRNQGMKLEAELSLHGRRAASFAAVVLDDAPGCLASLDERLVQAGRMIGNEAGSFLVQPRDPALGSARPRRWIVPLALAVDAALIAGGLWMVNSAVDNENTAAALGLDPAVPNNRLAWGRGMLLTAGAGALAISIYAAVR
jgi:hypothetical protein